jgi:hypothetical protein
MFLTDMFNFKVTAFLQTHDTPEITTRPRALYFSG